MAQQLDHLLQALQMRAGRFEALQPAADWQPLTTTDWPELLLVVLDGELGLHCPYTGRHSLDVGSLVALRCPSVMVRDLSGLDQAPARIAYGGIEALLPDGNPWITDDGALMRTSIAESDLLRTVQGELLQESGSPAPGSGVVVDCIAKRMFTTLMRQQVTLPQLSAKARRLSRVLDALRADLSRQRTLDELADLAGMSRTAFHQAFCEAYGESPLGCLTRLRMERAQTLLKGTDQAIKAIGLGLGYKSRSSFWSAFKAATGQDPTSFRAQSRTPLQPG